MADTAKLLTNYRLGNLMLNNRIALSPMTRASATPDGLATEEMARYYARFAAGGFGLLITESVYIDRLYSQGSLNQPGLTNKEQTRSWIQVSDAVHRFGSKFIAQLAHAGALSQGNPFTNGTVAPSSYRPEGERVALYGPGGKYPEAQELSKDEIKELINDFTAAAARAKEAGFDGVEIHAANGFLPDQFLSDITNRRTDEYGGSLENRLRFLLDIIRTIKAETGNHFVVGVRISQAKMNNYAYKWPNAEEDAKVIFSSVTEAGADYIHTYEYDSLAPAFADRGPTLAELAKKYGRATVIVNGGLIEPGDAVEALAKGGDLVALAKIALSNHDWPRKVKNGEAIRPFDGQVLAPSPNIKESELMALNQFQSNVE